MEYRQVGRFGNIQLGENPAHLSGYNGKESIVGNIRER